MVLSCWLHARHRYCSCTDLASIPDLCSLFGSWQIYFQLCSHYHAGIMVERTVEIGSAQGLLIYRICRSQQQEGVWLVVVLSYKVAQLVVLVSLTLLTRRIPNKTFATTSLRIFTYIFSAVFGIGFAVYYCFLYFSRSTNPNIKTVILYFTLSSLLLLYILCVFSPPLTPVIHSKLWERKLKVSRISRKRKQCSDQVRARKTSEDALL